MSEQLQTLPAGELRSRVAAVSGRPSTTGPAPSLTGGWREIYIRVLLVGDLAILLAALAIAGMFRFGLEAGDAPAGALDVSYETLGVAIAVGWWTSLNIFRTRSPRILGHGTEEPRRVVRATWAAFAVMAMLSVAFKIDASRIFVAVAFPAGLVGLIVWRWLARRWLHRRRAEGRGLSNVLVVGGLDTAERIRSTLQACPQSGYRVAGVWVPDVHDVEGRDRLQFGVPVLGRTHTLVEMVALTRAGAVMVSDTEHLGPDGLRELTWQLEGTGVEVMLSPNVVDVVGSRLRLHELGGLPMVHVDEPQYASASRFLKNAFDRLGAASLLMVLSPILIVTALAVKFGDRGPIFFRQTRIGLNGEPFRMTKFRSMRVGADREIAEIAALNESDQVLFKVRQDPRVTAVGRVIRRYSLDELPQLFDVLRGDMSLVGPRPPLASEVAQYPQRMHRRLLIRPGITGMWQISGRSDLPFDEAVRLDLWYVDNWSMVRDIWILGRTAQAVLFGRGAY